MGSPPPGRDPGTVAETERVERSVYRHAIDAFGDVAAAIGEPHEQDELLHLIARQVCELVDVPRCYVYLRDAETGLYRGRVGHDDKDIDAAVKRLICGTTADGFTREIIETLAPVVIRNARSDPRPVKSAMRDWGIVSIMGVPMVIGGAVVGLLFLDSKEKAHEFTPTHQALASAFADLAAVAISQSRLYSELRASHDTVARQNAVLRRAAATDDKLTNLVLKGCDLGDVAEAVSDVTHKPCAIYDADGHRLASAVPADLDDASPPRLLEADSLAAPGIAEALAALSPTKVGVVGPFPSAGLPHRFMVAPVTVRDAQWGSLVLSEFGGRFGGFDMLISRRSATIIALELSAERRAANAEWNARSSLAAELLRATGDREDLQRRAQFLGMALQRPHVLCLITGEADGDLRFPDARTVAATIRAAAPELAVIATEVAEGIAVILEIPGEGPAVSGISRVKKLAMKICASLDPEGRLAASISTACTGSGEFGRAYRQARELMACTESFGSSGVISADDLGAARVLLANADPTEVERFSRETLGPLLENGVAKNLLETLSCFFSEGQSVRRSALALDVHENTIRYRLSRIEELTGYALTSDPDAELSVRLALTVLRLQGLDPSPKGD
jgi:sugar diacid utilization regulator/GAF domain-containing protein